LGVGNRTKLGESPYSGSASSYFWGGPAGTIFWNDPKEEMIGLIVFQDFICIYITGALFANLFIKQLLSEILTKKILKRYLIPYV